jgi:ParB-like chromosome segregation protein Spo0J
MAIESLTAAPYNPRKLMNPGDPAWKKLEASLREFGLVEPLVWNETTGHVVGGHARLAILKQIGTTEVTVSVVHLSPEREKALNVVLNNREAQGRFDPAKLADLLSELEALSEFDLTGFDHADLRALRLEPTDEISSEEEPNRVEIAICVPRERYEHIAPRLDELVREFDLECHVKGL